MSEGKPQSVHVTWEDQERICKFNRLNASMHDLEKQHRKEQRLLEDLDDAQAELMLADDEDQARLLVGDSFWSTPKEEADEKLEDLTTAAKKRQAEAEEKLAATREQMSQLKVLLYAKFGNTINLEE